MHDQTTPLPLGFTFENCVYSYYNIEQGGVDSATIVLRVVQCIHSHVYKDSNEIDTEHRME